MSSKDRFEESGNGKSKDKSIDKYKDITNQETIQETRQVVKQEAKQDTKQEAKMSSEAKSLYQSHPNLKSAPSEWRNNVKEEPGEMTKQGSSYGEGNKCAPNNNIFFEEQSNHLSSKGD